MSKPNHADQKRRAEAFRAMHRTPPLLLLPNAWDAVFNPVVGAASDREAVRTGRRTRLLVAGGLALPAAFAAMCR